MKFLFALLLLLGLALPLHAETPWGASETIRAETARIERLFYRAETPERAAEIAERLNRVQTAWDQVRTEFGPSAQAITSAMAVYADSIATRDPRLVARDRQILWSSLMAGARDHTLAALKKGDARAAGQWLTIRDYARASGDTAAVLAVQALAQGNMDPQPAHDAVEAELLTVAASELRLALSRAVEDGAADRMIQYAGDLGRAEGLVFYLKDSLSEKLGTENLAALQSDLAQAWQDPAILPLLREKLSGYAPVSLSAEEELRRARLMRRFTALVWEEYKDGVRNGQISQHMEYNEARMFRDRAAIILGDLTPQIDNPQTGAQLAALLGQIKQKVDARADGTEVRPLVEDALALIDATYGEAVAQGGFAAALDALPAALDEMVLVAKNGDWAESELKRLEAYSWFDPDIEQRLVPRAPAMALRLESRFWEGSAEHPGLGKLIADHASVAQLAEEATSIKAGLDEARARIEEPLSDFGAVLQSAGIIFREGLEAVLIIAALLAAMKAEGIDATRFRRPIATGILAALACSFALWAAARWLISISTLSREALEGGTALLAAIVLIWLVMGLNAKGGHVASMRRRLAGSVTVGTVGVIAFLVVFREGFETVLFYEALLVDAAPLPVLLGLFGGAAAALAVGWLILASGRKLPLGVFFKATSVLLALLSIMLVGAGIRGLQTAGLISATPVAWFPDRDWLQLWFGLFPVAEPLILQGFVLLLFLGMVVLKPKARSRRQKAA